MRRVVVLALSLAAAGCAAATAGSAHGAVPAAGARQSPDWLGHRHAMPTRYDWLDELTPSDTYTIVVVRGMGRNAVLRRLGGVQRVLPDKTPRQAENYLFNHMRPDFSAPRVVQVQRRGHAIVVYAPYGVLLDGVTAKLSRGKVAAEFFTDVELDTYLTVGRGGKVVRQFDAGFKPPKKGALPEEDGLDWGRPDQNIWATAWAFSERLTLTHVSEKWFGRPHSTYVVHAGAFMS